MATCAKCGRHWRTLPGEEMDHPCSCGYEAGDEDTDDDCRKPFDEQLGWLPEIASEALALRGIPFSLAQAIEHQVAALVFSLKLVQETVS